MGKVSPKGQIPTAGNQAVTPEYRMGEATRRLPGPETDCGRGEQDEPDQGQQRRRQPPDRPGRTAVGAIHEKRLGHADWSRRIWCGKFDCDLPSAGRRHRQRDNLPAGGERPGLSFAITDHTTDDQIRVVKCGAVRVRQGVPEFAAFMDRAWRLG